ncbi:MAG: DUF883 family protein [Rhodomicrobium sp.]|nr:DUF883 family protein [Rhodomicrobium sp.]
MAQDPIQDVNATAAGSGHAEIEELRRQVKDLTDKYSSMAHSRLSDVKHTVQENMGEVEKQIREKPVQATLIAAGIGFLIGALISR